ncbi:hypothetical protein AB9E19_13200 [Rhizobium leguminosarum]|uniref:hypothetical protein n=1 Tax=Rhizobium leguminosarum TaxID=384 RepID=UPI003F94D6C3
MKSIVLLLTCAIALMSCSQGVVDTYGGGIGPELAYGGLSGRTAAEDNYVSFICRQSGAAPGTCSIDWQDFTLAGMNDIDARCDAYLAWLDSRRRTNAPIQTQIADTATTTATIMAATGAGGMAMGIVAAAFGFARNSFDNAQSRLLMEVNHSTVQTIVLSNQDRFRREFAGIQVGSRPTAIYVLRQYLRLCMPYTIENQINSTIVTYQLGGASALANAERTPLIDLASVRREVAKPETKITRPPVTTFSHERYALVATRPNDRSLKLIQSALRAICAPEAEVETPNAHTVSLIKVMQQYRKKRAPLPDKMIDGKMNDGDFAYVAQEPRCTDGVARNFYEMKVYPTGLLSARKDITDLVNDNLPSSEQVPPDADEQTIRRGIAKVRANLGGSLELNDPVLSEQLTLELVEKL